MSVIRAIAADEYSKLAAVHDGFTPDPAHSISLIAEDAGEIIGRVFLLAPVHIEGIWVKEGRRSHTLGKKLMESAEDAARKAGISKLLAYGASAELENYLERLKFKRMKLSVWSKEI